MEHFLKNWTEKVRTLTRPTKKYADPLIHEFNWNKNITCFYMTLFYMLFVTFFFTVCDFSAWSRLVFVPINIGLFFSFVGLCRSYLWVFNVIYVFISLSYGFTSFDVIPEAAYAYSGYIFMITTNILLLSGDVKLTLFIGSFHTVVVWTKFRDALMKLIIEDDPEVFMVKYLRFTTFFFILMLFSNIGLIIILDKRSIELLRVKKSLETALEQQKTFLFSFSHELRNPINSLLGNLQLVLQGEALSAKAAEMVNVAKVCGEILLHNINNVLDIGKQDIGRLEVNPVQTQLDMMFQKTWSIYSELLKQKELKGCLRIDKDLPPVIKIDPHSLNQIMLNLIGNSIKFTEKGSVTVTAKWLGYDKISDKCFEPVPYDDTDEGLFEKEENLSSMLDTSKLSEGQPGFQRQGDSGRQINQAIRPQPQQASKGVLKITVKDTGSGMKQDALEKLFTKFSQVSENVSQRQIGTGLGLFITREICHAMDGEIRAYSKAGVGSTFVICIPTSTVPLSNLQRAGSEAIIRQLSQKHLKVLVADDSPFNVNLICNYFAQFEASVKAVAYNGYDIFLKYRQEISAGIQIDVLALDIDMPIMDGRQVCDSIRRYEKENGLQPVIILLISGNYDREQIEEYLNSEKANGFLRKPVSFSEFSLAVFELVVTH